MEFYWLNLETGELLTYAEMQEEAAGLYDLDDPTNSLELEEYYEMTGISVY